MSLTGWTVIALFIAAQVYVLSKARGASRSSPSTRSLRRSPRVSLPARPVNPELHDAAAKGDALAVRLSFRDGADPGLRTADAISPMGVAIANGHDDVVRALLDAGVDPNAPAKEDQPALFVAASYLRTSLFSALVESGAELTFTHPAVGSALTIAAAKGSLVAVEELLAAGVPIDLAGQGGARALHVAALSGYDDVVSLLLSRGASVDSPTLQGGTPLRSAAAGGHASVVALLLGNGADPCPVDAFDKRPIDYAREAGHSEVVAVLENATPLPRAERHTPRNRLAQVLPTRDDATLKTFQHARSENLSVTEIAASSLEAPSLVTLLRELAGPRLSISWSNGPGPDPRLPRRPVNTVLWSYTQGSTLGEFAHPAVDRPPDLVTQEIAGVAEYPYALPAWSRVASRAARQLGHDHLASVLAVMVHPPKGPAYLEPWDWWFRVQVAAALTASYMGEDPWGHSNRRSALVDILDGPADWACTAVVIALLDVARRDPSLRPSVLEVLLSAARRDPAPAIYQHAIEPAALGVLELAGVDSPIREEMDRIIFVGD